MNSSPPPCTGGYSLVSIVVHWLAAILVIALFFTHEGELGSTAYLFHVSGGAIVGVFLLWRVWHRVQRGSTDAPDQAAILNLAARLVHWALLVAIVVVVLSGYLLPWSLGRELEVFALGIPSPMGVNRDMHEIVERVHDVAGHLFVPLLALHVLGTIKHAVFDRSGAGLRMFKPIDGGR